MDRNARIISLSVAAFAMTIVVYLAWNPRGMPRYGGWFFPNTDTVPADSTQFDPVHVIGGVDTPAPDGLVRDGSTRVRSHLARLREGGLEVAREEIGTVVGDTVYDAVAELRPYWLEDELHAAVRVGGQLVGDVDALGNIPLASVDVMRLEFSTTEPHWVIQIFMK